MAFVDRGYRLEDGEVQQFEGVEEVVDEALWRSVLICFRIVVGVQIDQQISETTESLQNVFTMARRLCVEQKQMILKSINENR